ncbi:MAG TPA: hypothetical protein VFD30_04370 [Terriglobia bacterium]|jgi:hypothetical protein|nr:hypothetical protein [Terriglobia bacterium]
MTIEKRRIVAYLAGRIISARKPSGVYDQTSGTWTEVGAMDAPNHLSLYDYARACIISVVGSPDNLYLYDCGSGRHIQLKINGSRFSGYDFETQTFFNGSVSGNSIFFCDFQHSDYFKYSTDRPPRASRSLPAQPEFRR